MKRRKGNVSRQRLHLWLALAAFWNALAVYCLSVSEACRLRSLASLGLTSNEPKATSPNSGQPGRHVRAIGPLIVIPAMKHERKNGRSNGRVH